MNRELMIDRLARRASEPWDMIIIGGGATGLGIALDAASRGYGALLLEQSDFAKGTSSRSTKLIHGGVRYLRQGNISLVRDSLRERGLLMRNAPGLVRKLAFVLPGYRWYEPAYYGIGLKVYDLLSGSLRIGASQYLSRRETLKRLPGLRPENLFGGTLYYDAQFDDARLAVAVAQTAARNGAVLLNYCGVHRLLKQGNRVCGVAARDEETGKEFELHGRVVINAAGPFSDAVRRLDQPGAEAMISPSQGIHLTLDAAFLPGGSALMIPRTDDGRVLFAIPWHGIVLVGTTDTAVEAVELEPRPLPEEIDYLLDHAGRYLIKKPGAGDIRSIFAGLRPLVKPRRAGAHADTSEVSRDHVIRVSPGKLVTVTGGKWTTFRKMAEDAVDLAARTGALNPAPCRTRELLLEQPEQTDEEDSPGFSGLEWDEARVLRAVHHEMARTVDDVLARRTRALLLDSRRSMESAPRVAALLARELGRDERWIEDQVMMFREVASHYLPPGGPERCK